jgi:DNA-binding transcriptional MerR regulator
MAFSEDHVERLTGITTHQLRYWDRTGFFHPEFAAEDRREAFSRVYSFKDVVSLRVLNMLRNQHNVPLPHLREVSKKLAHLADEKWTKTTLYVLKKRVNFEEPDTGRKREVVSGQYALGIPLAVVVEDTERDVKEFQQRDASKVGTIAQNRLVAHNASVIAGTRISTAAIRRFSDAGYSVSEILAEYPGLTECDVVAALAHEARSAA